MKQKELEAATKKQLASMHGTASFTSSTNVTPAREKIGSAYRDSPETNPTSSIVSTSELTDFKGGLDLQVVAEEKSDGGEEVPENQPDTIQETK